MERVLVVFALDGLGQGGALNMDGEFAGGTAVDEGEAEAGAGAAIEERRRRFGEEGERVLRVRGVLDLSWQFVAVFVDVKIT